MALINCPECGHQVSTAADNCPNCGAPIPKKKATLSIKRETNLVYGATIGVNAFCDGVLIGSVGNGKEITSEVTAGKHTITLTPSGAAMVPGATQDITVKDTDTKITISFNIVMGAWGGKVKIKDVSTR